MRRMTLCCLTLGLFVTAPLHAQPDSLWSRTYGGENSEECHSLIQTADGGYALAGTTESLGAGWTDFCLVRTDENGDSLWSRTYGGEGMDECYSLVQTADGGYALAGSTTSFGAGYWNFRLVRTDENGDSLWSRTYGGIVGDRLSLVQTWDGGYALAGWTYYGAGGYGFWLVRTDENGDSLWSGTYGGHEDGECLSLVQTADGGYALAGWTYSFGAVGRWDFWLVRTDDNGDSLWSRTYGGEGMDICYSLVQTADGGFALAGYTYSFGAGESDFWLVRTDENGDSLWSRTYGGGSYEHCSSLVQTADGGYALAGYTCSFGAGDGDFWLVRTDENGDSLWSRTYDGEGGDECYSLVQTADGGFALAGSTWSSDAGYFDFWLVKLGPDPVSVPESDFILHPSAFILSPPYPNPFNAKAVTRYELRGASRVNLALYDINGRLVQTLMEGWQEAGEHRVVIDANRWTDRNVYPTVLPAGVYLLRLTDGRQVGLSKVCLIK